jgi:hypothetical protein
MSAAVSSRSFRCRCMQDGLEEVLVFLGVLGSGRRARGPDSLRRRPWAVAVRCGSRQGPRCRRRCCLRPAQLPLGGGSRDPGTTTTPAETTRPRCTQCPNDPSSENTPRSTRCSTRCPGGTSARPPTSGSPAPWCSCPSAGNWSRPIPASCAARRPTSGTTYQLRGDRVSHAHAAVVPPAGGRGRAGLRAGHRGAARRGCALPAPRRPGHHRPRGQARSGQARGGLREGDRGRDPSYQTVRGILAAGAE